MDAPAHGVRLVVAYDGTEFAGFQRQPGQRTVQGELERAIAAMTGHEVLVRAASRTDSGVHALGQVVGFDSAREIRPRGWRLGLNQTLPDDIRVQSAEPVEVGYNPRFDSLGKTYRYVLRLGEQENPLIRHGVWHLGKFKHLDVVRMRMAARMLEGTHDYRAFRSADDERESTVRTLWSIDVLERFLDDPALVAIEVRGSAFMKNMVRILVGTLVDVGRGRLPLHDVPLLLGEHAMRERAGQTAPAHGLTLIDVRLGRLALQQSLGGA